MKINGNTLIEILPLKELYTIYDEHERLKVFAQKGRTCVTCDREGVFLLITKAKDGSNHIDLFTEDFVLMTVDHITPKYIGKQLGWSKAQIEALENKQPMCTFCNNGKGHKTISNEQHRINRMQADNRKRTGTEVIWQLVNNPNVFDKSLAF